MDYCWLAAKAGKIVCGADAVNEQLIKNKVYLVIIAEDSSNKTKEKFIRISNEHKIKYFVVGKIDENSRYIGKKNKAIIGIVDKSFSEAISKVIIGGDAIEQKDSWISKRT